MSRSWELTDLEFRALCEDYYQGTLPFPLVFTSATPWVDDFEYELGEARRDLRARYGGELDAFGGALAKPDVLVALQAFGGDGNFDDPGSRVRVHAFRQRAWGFVVTQRPGKTVHHSAGFDIVECDPHALAERVLASVPTARAGRLPDIAIPDTARDALSDSGYRSTGSMISDNDEDNDYSYEDAMAFLRTPALRSGTIRVAQGRSKYGPRGRVEMAVLWRDLPGDGRYAMPLREQSPSATGMGTPELIEWVDERIALVLERLDRNMETEE